MASTGTNSDNRHPHQGRPDGRSADTQAEQRLMRRAGMASLAVAVLLFSIKTLAWLMTDSVALLGSLLDSLLDCIASLINLLFLYTALRPVDHAHRFGHGKAEPLGGIFQAVLIAGSALFLMVEAVRRLIEPSLPDNSLLGIGIMTLSCVIVGLLVMYQRMAVRRTGSLIVAGDALHGLGDIGINLGVIVALALSTGFQAPIIDPLIALVLAGLLLRGAWHIGRRAVNQLMDTEFSQRERERIRELTLAHPRVTDMHDLRTRRAGLDAFIQLHIEMDGQLSLETAHRIADEVEASIRAAFPEAEVLIHQDPQGREHVDTFLRS